MSNYAQATQWLYMLRFNRDQTLFRRNFQIEGVFAGALIFDALNKLSREAHIVAGKNEKKYTGFNQTEFVNRNLLEDEAKAFVAWFKTENERIPDMLGQIMVNEIKVSCTWNDANQCYIATFTGKEDHKYNPFKALSSRSDDWFEALAMTAYKHLILFRGGKWEGDTVKNNWG